MNELVDIEIINEEDNENYIMIFQRFGTYYELAEEIQNKGIYLPEYFDFIQSNGEILKPSESNIIDFKDIKIIKIRDLSQNESSSIDFKDIECGKRININVKKKGLKWRQITRGINLFGKCTNEKCEAYKLEVIQMIKSPEYDATKNNGLMECPICGNKIKMDNIGFYNCYYNFCGTKFDDETEDLKKIGIYIKDFSNAFISNDNMVKVNGKQYKVFKTQVGKLCYFDDKNDNVKYIKLIFQVKYYK